MKGLSFEDHEEIRGQSDLTSEVRNRLAELEDELEDLVSSGTVSDWFRLAAEREPFDELVDWRRVEEELENRFQPESYVGTRSGDVTSQQYSEEWETKENIQARIVGIDDNKVQLECLIDKEERIFQTYSFRKKMLESVVSIDIGNYVLVRYFESKGKCKYTFFDGENIVDKEIFETMKDYSYLDDLEAFN